MIIDVIDLELKNLQFSRNYDTNRYLRGKTLYNRFHLSWCTFTRGMEVIFELYFQRFRSSRSELPR